MPNPPEPLGLSLALGFWANHTAAMDALYDLFISGDADPAPDEEVDPDLLLLWKGSRQSDIKAVIEHAQTDARRFLKEAKVLLVSELGRVGSPVDIVPKATRDAWTARADLTPKTKDTRDDAFQLTLSIDSSPDSKLTLYVSIWRKGGKAMGAAMTGVLRDAYHGISRHDEAWYPGSAVIGAIPFLECMNGQTGSLDLDALLARLSSVLQKQDIPVLARLVDVGRE
jgi:hypothetical protein